MGIKSWRWFTPSDEDKNDSIIFFHILTSIETSVSLS